MRFIKPSYDIWNPPHYFEGILEHIERAGRVCYKSEDRIKYDECDNSLTAKPFVDKLIESDHLSVLEHGTIYLKIVNREGENVLYKDFLDAATWYYDNPYSRVNEVHSLGDSIYYVTTNYRVLVENNRLKDLRYLCAPTEYHEKRVTVHFTLDRAISMEFLRHRKMSFTQESTRYCNYSNKDKFGGEVTFIIPCWMDTIEEGAVYSYDTDIELWQKSEDANTSNFLQSIAWVEKNYLTLLHNSWTPQQARAVLPNALKTELVMTGFISDWKHFFELRDSNKAHPQARELASPLHKEFIEKGLIK